MKAKILKSKFFHIQVGDIGEVQEETKNGAAIQFTKIFEFTHHSAKQTTTRTYWFQPEEYQLL